MHRATIRTIGALLTLIAALTIPAASAHAAAAPTKHALLYGDSITWESTSWTQYTFTTHKTWTLAIRATVGYAVCDMLPQLPADLATYQPTVVALEAVGNSNRPCMVDPATGTAPAMDSPAYLAHYRADLAQFMSEVTATGAKMVFLNGPPVVNPTVPEWTQAVTDINAIAKTLAANYHGVSISNAPRNSVSKSGKFTQYKPCLPYETVDLGCVNKQIAVRTIAPTPDQGLHLCPTGLTFSGCTSYSSGERRWGVAAAHAMLAPPKPIVP